LCTSGTRPPLKIFIDPTADMHICFFDSESQIQFRSPTGPTCVYGAYVIQPLVQTASPVTPEALDSFRSFHASRISHGIGRIHCARNRSARAAACCSPVHLSNALGSVDRTTAT
jgi:hypothetical protein